MIVRFLTNTGLIILVAIVQISFLPTWPAPVRSLNLLLSLIIFLTAIGRFHQAVAWSWAGGLCLDILSGNNLGLTSLALLTVAGLINLLATKTLTNYSFYSLTVFGGLGILTYQGVISIGEFLIQPQTGWLFFESGYGLYFFWQLVLNFLILYSIYLIFHFLIGRFSIHFLGR